MSGQRRGKYHVGWEWYSNKGYNACNQCAALHGKKFYFEPRAGQQSADNMPQPPLHPNCRCYKKEILDYTYLDDEWAGDEPYAAEERPAQDSPEEQQPVRGGRPFESHGISDRFHRGAVKIFGVHWGSDGRSITDGPNYGNHGGQNWGSGRNTEGMSTRDRQKWDNDDQNRDRIKPIDKMDRYFKEHDIAYDKCKDKSDSERCRLIEADEVLVRQLRSLPDNPNAEEWKSEGRKNAEEVAEAKRYRSYAIWFFEGRSNWYRAEEAEGDLHGDSSE